MLRADDAAVCRTLLYVDAPELAWKQQKRKSSVDTNIILSLSGPEYWALLSILNFEQ